MTPVSQLSCFSYELRSWELETRKNTIEKLDKCLEDEKLKFVVLQENFNQQINSIERRHQIIDGTFPLVVKYVKGLHSQFRDFENRTCITQAKIEEQEKEKKYLQQEYLCLRKLETKTQSRLKEFAIFKNYLSNVCLESNGKFPQITDLLEEFAFIGKIRETMFQRIQESASKRKEKQDELNKYLKSSEFEILKLHNKTEDLKMQKEKLDSEIVTIDLRLGKVQGEMSEQVLTIANIQMSIWNLYMELCRKLHHPITLDSIDTIAQVLFMETTMNDLKQLTQRVRESTMIPDISVAAMYQPKEILAERKHSQDM